MPRKIVYSDLDPTLRKTRKGDILIHYDEDAVLRSVKNIIATVSGERPRNAIGSSLLNLLFQPMNDETARSIRSLLWRDIGRLEPRVRLISLNVISNFDENFYDITLTMQIRKIKRQITVQERIRSFA